MKFIGNRKNVHFMKMFLCIAAVLIIISLIACVAYQTTYKDKTDYDIFNEHISDFQNEYVNFNERVSVAYTVAMLLSEYECVKDYAFGSKEYENVDFSALKEICEKISENQTTFSHLQYDIYLTNFETNIVATLYNTMSVADMYNTIQIDSALVEGLFEDCTSPGVYAKAYLSNGNSDLCYIVKKIYPNHSYVYIINHFLPVDYVRYSQKDGFVLSYVGNKIDGIDNDIISKEIVSEIKEKSYFIPETVKTIDLAFFGENIFYKEVEYAEDIIIIGRYIDLKTADVFRRWVLPIVICICFALLAAWIIAKWAYHPIVKMLDVINPIHTEYTDELFFLMERVRDIKENNEELKKNLAVQENMYAKKIMMDILNGYVWGNGVKEYAYKYNLNEFEHNSLCILFEFEDAVFSSNNGIDSSEIYKIAEKMFEIINEHISRMQVYAMGYILSQRRVLFVAKNALNLKKDISIVVESIKRNSNVNVFAIMSKISNSYDELRDAYEELIFCADKKFLVAKEGVLTVEETKNKTILNFYYPIGLESEIIENVIAGEKEKTFLLLKRLLDNNEKSFAASEDNLQNFQYSMLVTVERILQKTNKKREDIPQLKDSLEKLFSSTSKDEISFRIKQIFGLLFEEIDNIEKILKKGIHEEIYNYINEKYCEDISMTDISLKFNVSISFISKALKEKYNINFKSYINDLRVMKAVEIMDENPKIKIKELSQRVGFNSSTSFIRVFQRIQGITPKQYIEAKINKNK